MEFNAPAGDNLFDDARIVGKPTPRIDGPLKTAPGTVVEEVEFTEDVIRRKAAA